jgi:leucyl aminopeptidase (aminopeptidase T)
MNSLEIIRSIRLITDVCIDVRPGEKVLCVADRQEYFETLTLLASECIARGAEAAVTLIEPRRHYYDEPPSFVTAAMEKADIVVVMMPGSLVHTAARRQVNAGIKIAILEGPRDYFMAFDLTKEQLLKVKEQTEALQALLTKAQSARLLTKAGTDLTMSLEGRTGIALLPFAEKGMFCVVPGYAEAACAPIEDSVEGAAVIDAATVGAEDFEEIVQEPYELKFRKGQIVSISGGRDARKLEAILAAEKAARAFAELGVNSNFFVPKKLRGSRLDMAIGGNAHIGLGRNEHIGGKSKANNHLDLSMVNATLILDGKTVVEEGVLKL